MIALLGRDELEDVSRCEGSWLAMDRMSENDECPWDNAIAFIVVRWEDGATPHRLLEKINAQGNKITGTEYA
jgi:hypothetical protein